MRFWDASAIVPLLAQEGPTARLTEIARQDPEILVWWGTEVECASALRRREREGRVAIDAIREAQQRLLAWRETWLEVQPGAGVRERALRLLAFHPLRSLDALQLAAALQGAEQRPGSLPFVCLDRRLCEAASREGLPVITLAP